MSQNYFVVIYQRKGFIATNLIRHFSFLRARKQLVKVIINYFPNKNNFFSFLFYIVNWLGGMFWKTSFDIRQIFRRKLGLRITYIWNKFTKTKLTLFRFNMKRHIYFLWPFIQSLTIELFLLVIIIHFRFKIRSVSSARSSVEEKTWKTNIFH